MATDKKELTFCPFKENMVYLTTCEKECSYSREKCEEAKAARKAKTRFCIDCQEDEPGTACPECLDTDMRERPSWKMNDADLDRLPDVLPGQLSLFAR